MKARETGFKDRRGRPTPARRARGARRVVCVAGMPAAGKEEVVRVARRLGFSVIRMGDIVRAEARKRGLPLTDAAVGGMAHQERVEHGFGIWAERTVPHVRGTNILIDGLRGKAELDVYRRVFGGRLSVLAIHASPATRFERTKRRARSDDVTTLVRFGARDERELAWGLGDVIATADALIVNEASPADLRRTSEEWLGRVLRSRRTA